MRLKKVMMKTAFVMGIGVMAAVAPKFTTTQVSAAVVQDLKQTDAGSSSVTVTGSNLEESGEYTVYYSDNDGQSWQQTSEYAFDGEINVWGLEAGTHYDLKVANEDGESNTIEVVTGLSDYYTTVKQKSATPTTATISWGKVAGADGYEIRIDDKVVGDTSNTSYKVSSGLSKKNSTYVCVVPYIETSEYRASSHAYNSTSVYLKPAKPKVVLDSWYKYAESMNIDISTPYYYYGYETRFYNAKGKQIKKANNKLSLSNASMNSVYSAKARIYVKINGKKVYSAWSNKMYAVAQPTVKVKNTTNAKTKARNLKLSWTGVKGVQGYDIYVSASGTKEKKFKKVASVSSKKKSCTVKKLSGKKLSKNKTYYVYVVAKKKVGKQTMKSSHVYCYSVSGETYTSN